MLNTKGSIAMQRNRPPFKRFASERFDGTSINDERPVVQSGGRQRQDEPHSRPIVERDLISHSSLPTHIPQPTPDCFQPPREPQDFNVVSPVTADDSFSWRLRTAEGAQPPPLSTVRQRRQHMPPQTEGALPHPLQLSTSDLVCDHVPRSVSQPNTPGFYPHTQQRHLYEISPLNTSFPRSPILPGDSRRRFRSATRTEDANFTDEEFHLFVQATAGLGTDYDASNSEDARTGTRYLPRSDRGMISPEQETPTTAWALHQSAQMPYGTYIPHQHEVVASRLPIQRLETLSSSSDLWLQSTGATSNNENDDRPIEDELPDYASSQAQAQAVQRVEAARRAQELQRRWRESHP